MGSGKTIRRRKRDGVSCLSCLVQDVHGGRARTCELQQEEEEKDEKCFILNQPNWDSGKKAPAQQKLGHTKMI